MPEQQGGASRGNSVGPGTTYNHNAHTATHPPYVYIYCIYMYTGTCTVYKYMRLR